MTKKECFKLNPSPLRQGFWIITPVCENFYLDRTSGSFIVIAARLLNLPYYQYLRFLRDELGGEIVGKNCMYPTVYLKRTKEVDEFVKLLNARANQVLWERENPNWEKHQ